MSLLFTMNLGFAWGEQEEGAGPDSNVPTYRRLGFGMAVRFG